MTIWKNIFDINRYACKMLIRDKFSDILTLDDFDNISLPEITRNNVCF